MPLLLLITLVIVDSHALNLNKLVNLNNIVEHIQFQLRGLLVFAIIK